MSGRYFDFSFWDCVYFLGALQEFLWQGAEDEQAVPRGAWVQVLAGDLGYGDSVGAAPEQRLTLPFITARRLPACLRDALGLLTLADQRHHFDLRKFAPSRNKKLQGK